MLLDIRAAANAKRHRITRRDEREERKEKWKGVKKLERKR
jgi:hypothetical protein